MVVARETAIGCWEPIEGEALTVLTELAKMEI